MGRLPLANYESTCLLRRRWSAGEQGGTSPDSLVVSYTNVLRLGLTESVANFFVRRAQASSALGLQRRLSLISVLANGMNFD